MECESAACDPLVQIETQLPVTRDGAGRPVVTVCKNRDCRTTQMRALWRWDDSKDQPIPSSTLASDWLGMVDGSKATISALSTGRPATSPYAVTFEFRGDTRKYKPGDVYSAEWKSMTGKVLLRVEKVVKRYDESHPGGKTCSPVTCNTKTFRE